MLSMFAVVTLNHLFVWVMYCHLYFVAMMSCCNYFLVNLAIGVQPPENFLVNQAFAFGILYLKIRIKSHAERIFFSFSCSQKRRVFVLFFFVVIWSIYAVSQKLSTFNFRKISKLNLPIGLTKKLYPNKILQKNPSFNFLEIFISQWFYVLVLIYCTTKNFWIL